MILVIGFIKTRANMAGCTRPINMRIFITNRKLPSIHSVSVPRSRSRASTFSYAEKSAGCNMGTSLVFAMLLVVSTRCDEGQPEVDLFHQADANNDDKLTRIELNTVFLLFDIDNDTKISPTEFVKDWVDVYHLGGGTEAQILFTRADGNDDGYLDAKDVPTVFTYFDMNDDGFIDISEFLTQWGDLKLHPVGQIAVSVDITG